MTGHLRTFINDESAATAIEYALIASFLSVFIVGALIAMGENMIGMYDYIKTYIVDALAG